MSEFVRLNYDITTLLNNPLRDGIRRVAKNWLIELTKINPEESGFIINPVDTFNSGLSNSYQYLNSEVISSILGTRKVKDASYSSEVFLFPAYDSFVPERNLDLENLAKSNTVVSTVYDILPLEFPEWFPDEQVVLRFQKSLYLQSYYSDLIIVNSETVKERLIQQLAKWSFSKPEKKVVKVALSGKELIKKPPYDFSKIRGIKSSELLEFLVVGTIEPRKGYTEILEAFLNSNPEKNRLKLTVIGRLGWKAEGILKLLSITKNKFPKNFQWLNNCDDEMLEEQYAKADICIFASHDEGFGLPVVEAMDRGKICVVRDIPVFRETSQNAAIFFGENGDIADLNELFTNPGNLLELGKYKLLKYKTITQKESAEELINVIRSLKK